MNLKEMILSKMPSDLNDLEKARYLYIELGRVLSFSTKFNNTDDLSMGLMRYEKVDVTNFNGTQVNCIMWSSLYSQLLNSVGIENTIVKQGHDYVSFYIDGVRWCADATYGEYMDLARIHNDDETCYFGIALVQKDYRKNMVRKDEDSRRLVKELDDKIGYNNQERQNVLELKSFLQQIQNGTFKIRDVVPDNCVTLDELIFGVEYLFTKLGVLKNGYYEAKAFTKELMSLMLTSEQLERVKGIELKRTNNDKEVDIVQCITVQGKDKFHYYLLAPNLPIRKVTEDEIVKLAVLGYGIDEKEIPGIIFPRNFKAGKVSTDLRYKLQKNFVSKVLLDYDRKQNVVTRR